MMLGRRAFLGSILLLSSGCLGSGTAPSAADGDVETPDPAPDSATVSPTDTPSVVTAEHVETRIESAPLVVHDARGFSFSHPANWRVVDAAENGTVELEYTTEDGRVLGTLRAWGSLNTAYDEISEAEAETVRQLTAADHHVVDTRPVSLPSDREGRVVEYVLTGRPVRGATVVTLAGPWILRLVVLVHTDAYTSRLAETIDDIVTSLTYTG